MLTLKQTYLPTVPVLGRSPDTSPVLSPTADVCSPLPPSPFGQWLCPSCISRTLPSRKRKFANGAGGGGNNKRPAANGVHKPPGGRGRPRAAKQKAQASSSSQASENDGSHGAAAERERNQESSPPSMGLVGADIERELDTVIIQCKCFKLSGGGERG